MDNYMKVYELMSKLEVLPSGAEVMCGGVKSPNDFMSKPPVYLDDDNERENLYAISESIVDVYIENDNKVYLQF